MKEEGQTGMGIRVYIHLSLPAPSTEIPMHHHHHHNRHHHRHLDPTPITPKTDPNSEIKIRTPLKIHPQGDISYSHRIRIYLMDGFHLPLRSAHMTLPIRVSTSPSRDSSVVSLRNFIS